MEANYFTILWWFLPCIHMSQPWVYMCSPSWLSLPPPSPFHPSGSSQCTSPERPVSCIEPGLEIYFTYVNIHVSMLFSQIIPPFSAICKASSNNHFAFLYFFFLGMILIPASCTMLWNSIHSSSGTLSEKARVGWFERIAFKHVHNHMWTRSPVHVQCMRQGAQGWCTGMTLRDGMGREVRGRVRMGNTCTPMADSCECMAKTTTIS